ncbi:MAG: S-formylglutathione hydrolase [Geminicoccaceae bacterium]|nr:S-formylglutathione hydrolase [Geminicoccaceae bacterium]
MTLEEIGAWKSFGGWQKVFRHQSNETGTAMEFSVFLPPAAERGPCPLLWYLSGLTCTWENVTAKGGFQRHAAEHGLIVVCPDTSPRGLDLEGEHDTYDFGSGAGFYLDATREPWSTNYRMESYVVAELPALVEASFPADTARQGIFGHSMGGHGALTLALKNPGTYESVSAFAPIASPMRCPWGEKALGGYLGPNRQGDRQTWRAHDTTALIEDGARVPEILVDQGTGDNFLAEQLKPELLEQACTKAAIPLTLRRQEGYDHSYYFIATFMGDHVAWHAERLAR